MPSELLDQAIQEWAAGRYYEAHEILEDVAEQFDEADPSFEIALALTRAAACLHKLSADVGVRAVPGKLDAALSVLRDAPEDWCDLALGSLVAELEDLGRTIAPLARGAPVPVDLQYPVLRRR